jgi:small multidrug resistance pump
MGYLFLILTILVESTAVILMKLSNGFANKPAGIAAVAAYALSFLLLNLALKYLPAGTTNAIWAGASTLLVTLAGVWLFKEHLTPLQIFSLVLIVLGIIGLNLKSA